MINYVCVLFVGDGVKLSSRLTIRQYVGLESKTGENRGN
jgi:hypothetical protein